MPDVHKKLKTIFLGTPDISVPSLEILYQHPLVEVCGVITPPARPKGRGHKEIIPPVGQFALDNKIPYWQTANINKEIVLLSELENLELDFIIVFAFSQFLGKKILEMAKYGCFNIHTSLLPELRGAAPIQYAFLNGLQTTGVTLQKMVKKMDAGDIVIQKEVSIGIHENAGLLYTKLKFLSPLVLNEFVEILSNKKSIPCTPQDESKVTFAPTLKKEDGHINFAQDSCEQILRKVKAFTPWPGTYCMLNNKRLLIQVVEKIANPTLGPGKVETKTNHLLVGTKDGTVRLSKVQLSGKKSCSDTEFLNGFRQEIILS